MNLISFVVQIDNAKIPAVSVGFPVIHKHLPYFSPDTVRDLFHRSLKQNFTLFHHQDRIRNVRNIRNDMGGQDHDFVPGKAGDNISKTYPLFRIQSCGI